MRFSRIAAIALMSTLIVSGPALAQQWAQIARNADGRGIYFERVATGQADIRIGDGANAEQHIFRFDCAGHMKVDSETSWRPVAAGGVAAVVGPIVCAPPQSAATASPNAARQPSAPGASNGGAQILRDSRGRAVDGNGRPVTADGRDCYQETPANSSEFQVSGRTFHRYAFTLHNICGATIDLRLTGADANYNLGELAANETKSFQCIDHQTPGVVTCAGGQFHNTTSWAAGAR